MYTIFRGRIGRIVYPRVLQYFALDWRKADHAHRAVRRLTRGYGHNDRPVTLGRSESWQPRTDSGANEEDTNNEAEPEIEDAASTTSFTSDRTVTQLNEFGDLLISMIEAERVRSDSQNRLSSERAALLELMSEDLGCQANMRHLRYRRSKDLGLNQQHLLELDAHEAGFESKRSTCLLKQGQKLLEIRRQEARLQEAITQQAEGEPTLLRAVHGYMRNARVIDPLERKIPREFGHALRLAADCWRVRQQHKSNMVDQQRQSASGPITKESDGCVYLSTQQESVLGEEAFRAEMAQCYAVTQETMIRHGLMDPADAEASPDPEPRGPTETALDVAQDEMNPQVLLQKLSEAHLSVREAEVWLHNRLRWTYQERRNFYMTTYEDDGLIVNQDEQSPQDAFDREHMARVHAATEVLDDAQTELRRLQLLAAQAGVADPEENDLLISMDHPDDGFTGTTHNTLAEAARPVGLAHLRPGVYHWMETVSGNVYKDPSEPSAVMATLSAPSARSVRSEGDGVSRRDLIARWNAELLDIREAADQLHAVSRAEDLARIAATAARVAARGQRSQ